MGSTKTVSINSDPNNLGMVGTLSRSLLWALRTARLSSPQSTLGPSRAVQWVGIGIRLGLNMGMEVTMDQLLEVEVEVAKVRVVVHQSKTFPNQQTSVPTPANLSSVVEEAWAEDWEV